MLSLASLVCGDVYMQYPPGGNNRLDEGGGNRNNNNRLMDTQNNAKGGYGFGGTANQPADAVYYFTGSQMPIMWTTQHSCGSENSECQTVIQYICNDAATVPEGIPTAQQYGGNVANQNTPAVGEGPLRDGTDGNTPDPNNADANRGLHEPASYYKYCDERNRNQGLYTSDQNLNGNDARRTRQNPNGARSGLECPEERDYWPYWAPAPYVDVAVLTNNLGLCPWYQAESQNVKERYYCANQIAEIDQASCTGAGGTWTMQNSFGEAAPLCIAHPVTRDNHLGNTGNGKEVQFNWTVPTTMGANNAATAQNCVVRLRYNITTGDTRLCEDPSYLTKKSCTDAGKIWSAMYLDSSHNNKDLDDTPPLIDGNPDVDLGGFLSATGGTNSKLELAVNTNQYGRTFEDRSHRFSVKARPVGMPTGTTIFNLNVRGKRGNIVQTYPATEYDFTPTDLSVSQCDYVHFQWTGNGNTNNNGNNNGEGTNNEDKHNLVQIASKVMNVPLPASATSLFDVTYEWNPEQTGTTFGGPRARDDLIKQFALVKQTGCAANPNNDQNNDNCEKLNAAAFTVDLGMLGGWAAGDYKYMSSRDMNFSNRAAKGTISVTNRCGTPPLAPENVVATPIVSENPEQAQMQLSWSPPGSTASYTDTLGNVVVGTNEGAATTFDYIVQRSCDGGETWVTVEGDCSSATSTCTVEGLPAGTTCEFQVLAGGSGGWGTPSDPAVARTEDSDASRECFNSLNAAARGEAGGLSEGAIAAIVIGSIAGVIIMGFAFFMLRRRTPPPPPPEFKSVPPHGAPPGFAA